MKATSAIPNASTPPPTRPIVGPELADDAREGRTSGKDRHAADRFTRDEDGCELPAPGRAWRRSTRTRTASVAARVELRRRPEARARTEPAPRRRATPQLCAHRLQFVRNIVVIRDRPPVVHDHDERLEDVAELFLDVLLEVEGRIGGDRRGNVRRDEHREPARIACGHGAGDALRHPEIERALGGEHQREEQRRAPGRCASRGSGTSAVQTSAAL